MPEAPRTVIVNTTPIIALALIGQVKLLQQLYGEVVIPPAVWAEIIAGGPGSVGVGELQEATYIQTVSLSDPRRADLL